MSIFENLFGRVTQPVAPVQQQPAQQQVPAQPGNLPAQPPASNPVQTAGTANNGIVPNNPATDGTVKSGLDAFADIWNTENNGQQGQPLFNVSQEKMMEAARKQNFTANAPKELMERIAAGGPDAVNAIADLVNFAAQNNYAQSAFASTKLIEGALEKGQFARNSDVDNRFKSLSVSNSLQAENPVFSNPAAKPMLDMIQTNMQMKYPNATPAELTRMSKDYLTSFAEAFKAPETQQQQQQQAKAKQGENWENFFS